MRDTETEVGGADYPCVSDLPRTVRVMGITRFATRVHLSTRVATAADTIAPAGTQLWVITYTVVERGRESSFTVPCVAEAAARRMVRNLLADRLPGTAVEDVYSEDVG
ncbi:Uncharacterised protein [Mycobacteroides abscessus subsp. abscessus]|nr:hypothetical protein [Mycobacteroides abscessus]SHX67932.1 Uncharacterised protein [Mycobacteroides abscessus subsp. abscessus]SLC90899.1 Uncharacterised protein [Mycobacteroides abscessus subsp. massiliense]SIC58566.1 Uncharacterised protein [Mycobacteroides abscessus subsp. abscessus]SID62832.1 Uncharacterised protein [Mycobacteroides abscessus subsp. abscessus]